MNAARAGIGADGASYPLRQRRVPGGCQGDAARHVGGRPVIACTNWSVGHPPMRSIFSWTVIRLRISETRFSVSVDAAIRGAANRAAQTNRVSPAGMAEIMI